MSTPPFLDLPKGVRTERLATERGEFAALVATSSDQPLATAVLIPGYCGSKEDFIAILEPLSTGGVQVVAVDPRGQYETPGPDDLAAYDPVEQGADMVAMLETLSATPAHLLGHSFGGLVAREAVIARPDLVGSLILMCSGPAALSGPAADRVKLQLAALEQHDLATVQSLRESFAAAQGEPLPPPEIQDFLRRRFTSNSHAGLIAVSRQLLSASDRVGALAATAVPVLVALGEGDDAWPRSEQREMAGRLRAEHAEIPGAGHSPAVDDPSMTARLLARFWFGHDSYRS